MPRSDGSIVIDTKILDGGFKQGLAGLRTMAARSGVAIGAGIGIAAAALGALAVKGVKLASDLQEVQNVVDVTFGDGAEQINKWAKEAGEAFGLSELQAKRFTGTLGAMLKSQGMTTEETMEMSKALSGLTGDFASFYNLEHEEAFEKIRAGISGETEPLKQLGINMSEANLEAYALEQGINKSMREMSQAEKTQLRFNYLMKVSADAQGDFARTSDSFANQMRIVSMRFDTLAASLGEKLLPTVSDALAGLLGWIDDFDAPIQSVFDDLSSLLSGESLDYSGTKYGDAAINIGERFGENLGLIIGDALKNVAGVVGNIAPGLISALGAVIVTLAQQVPTLLPPLASALIEGIVAIAAALPQVLPQIVTAFSQVIQLLAAALPTLLPLLLQGFMALVLATLEQLPVILPALISAFTQVITLLAAALPTMLPQLLDGFITLITALITALPVILPALIEAVFMLVVAIAEALPGMVGQIVAALVALIPMLVAAIVQLGEAMEANFKKFGPRMRDAANNLGLKLWDGLKRVIPTILKGVARLALDLIKPFTNQVKAMSAIGSQLVSGLWNGIGDKFGWIVGRIKSFASNVTDKLKGFFGIQSPSKLFRDEIGVNLALGVGEGFSKGVRGAFADMQRSVSAEMGRLSIAAPNMGGGGAAAQSVDNRKTINFHGQVRTYSEMLRAQRDIERGLVG